MLELVGEPAKLFTHRILKAFAAGDGWRFELSQRAGSGFSLAPFGRDATPHTGVRLKADPSFTRNGPAHGRPVLANRLLSYTIAFL